MNRKLIYLILALQVLGLIALYAWHHSGRGHPTVMLRTFPVDPRDYLRGDYIILNYEISQIPTSTPWQVRENDDVFVVLEEKDGFAHTSRIQPWKPGYGERFIKGRVRHGRIEFDLEKYFVPEGLGTPPPPLTVEISLRADGRAQINQLYSQGRPWPPRP